LNVKVQKISQNNEYFRLKTIKLFDIQMIINKNVRLLCQSSRTTSPTRLMLVNEMSFIFVVFVNILCAKVMLFCEITKRKQHYILHSDTKKSNIIFGANGRTQVRRYIFCFRKWQQKALEMLERRTERSVLFNILYIYILLYYK